MTTEKLSHDIVQWLSENFEIFTYDYVDYFVITDNVSISFLTSDIIEIYYKNNASTRILILDGTKYIPDFENASVIYDITEFQNIINIIKVFNI